MTNGQDYTAGDTGQRNDLHARWDGAGWGKISSRGSENGT